MPAGVMGHEADRYDCSRPGAGASRGIAGCWSSSKGAASPETLRAPAPAARAEV